MNHSQPNPRMSVSTRTTASGFSHRILTPLAVTLALGTLSSTAPLVSCQTNASPPQAPQTRDSVRSSRSSFSGAGGIGGKTASNEAAAGAPVETTRPDVGPTHCQTPSPQPDPSRGKACGALDCLAFPRAEDALAYVVSETRPLVLAVGEIHAQKDSRLKASPTERFAKLLPMFCETTRHIIIELWTGRNDCGDRRVEEVRQAQRPITRTQADTNQNDFLELGNVAKANRIQPHALVPTCDDFQSIVAAKGQDIARMLELTATRTADLTEQLLKRAGAGASKPFAILYGGAMHNDISPTAGREAFSYGPRLRASTQDQITELDLVLREQVKDTEVYRRLAWYPYFRNETLEKHYVLYRLGPRSFSLIYPTEANLP